LFTSDWSGVPTGGVANGGIKKDGTLWGVGYNARGGLNNNNTGTRLTYTQIGTDNTWVYSAIGICSGAIKSDGSLWMWGEGGTGCLGDNTIISKSSPIQIAPDKTFKYIAPYIQGSADVHTLAITQSGELWGWGRNNFGQIGAAVLGNTSSPLQTTIAGNTWIQACAISTSSMALKSDGTLWGWGSGSNGVLGITPISVSRSTPVQVGTASNWSQITGSATNFAGLKSDGTVWVWGPNASGQLGQNDTIARSSPTFLTNNAYKIAGGAGSLFVLKLDGSLWYTGDGLQGTSGTNTNISYSSLVQTVIADNSWIDISTGTNR
jgi:alpha-tubulin suppressor-like RCC1 family protein